MFAWPSVLGNIFMVVEMSTFVPRVKIKNRSIFVPRGFEVRAVNQSALAVGHAASLT